jgi:hypothetical protein
MSTKSKPPDDMSKQSNGNGKLKRASDELSDGWPIWNPHRAELDRLLSRTLDAREREALAQVSEASRSTPPQVPVSWRVAAVRGLLRGVPGWMRGLAILLLAAVVAAVAVKWLITGVWLP